MPRSWSKGITGFGCYNIPSGPKILRRREPHKTVIVNESLRREETNIHYKYCYGKVYNANDEVLVKISSKELQNIQAREGTNANSSTPTNVLATFASTETNLAMQ